MNLLHFGTSDRRLLGVYHPSATPTSRGAIICAPWGQEYLRAHQALRVLGQLLASKGRHVLRFDWYGSGDSGGDVLEGGCPESWLKDLELAIEELQAIAQVSSLSLIGLRLGASVAAMATASRGDVDSLVLWDPVFDGPAYVRELTESRGARRPSLWHDSADGQGEQTYSVLGFPLTPEMRRGIAEVGLDRFQTNLPGTLLVSTVDDPERYDSLRERLRGSGTDLSEKAVGGPIAWVEEGDFGTSGMPVQALRGIAEWLT